jgi:enoyl-CoA hydratase/carnithine racemase
LAHGLVRSVHPAAELLPAAEALAREIAANTAPVSVAVTRRLLWHGLTAADPMEAHYAETLALNARGVSADAAEGIGAFFDKRAAAFPDRVGRDLPPVSAHLAPAAFDPARLRLLR